MKEKSKFLTKLIKEITFLIEQEMDKEDICGLSIAITNEREILWSKGFGFTDRNKTEEVTADTLFSTQSMNKCLTATAFLILVTKNLVDLDDPIRKYYPKFTVNTRFGNYENQIEQITFRRMLSHWAGFTHEAPVGNNFDDTPCTFEEHIESVADSWLRSPVGFEHSYSNIGIDLTGYVMGKIKNTTYFEVMDKELFSPLGIEKATFDINEALKLPFAKGHSGKHETPTVQVAMMPAGGLYISVNELAKFVAFHLRKGKNNGEQLITSNLFEEMYKIQYRDDSEFGYGLGIYSMSKMNDSQIYCHGGGGYGYATSMDWIPEYDIGVVILTNDMKHSSNGKITRKVFEMFADLKSRPDSVSVDPAHLKRFEGTYIAYRMPLINVVFENERLIIFYSNGSELELFPQDDTTFITKEEYKVKFELNDESRPISVRIDHPIWPHIAQINSCILDSKITDLEIAPKIEGLYEYLIYGRLHFAAIAIFDEIPYIWFGDWIRLQSFEEKKYRTPDGEVLIIEENKLYFKNIPLVKTNIKPDSLFEKIENAPVKYDTYRGAIASLVEIQNTLNGIDKALNLIDRAFSIDNEFKSNYSSLGKKLYALGKLDEASQCFVKLVEIDSKDEDALSFLRRIELRKKYP